MSPAASAVVRGRSMPKLRLVTIGPSHYCEKARWALDRAGIGYVEEAHVPMVHWLFTLPRTRTRTVPVLLTPHGHLTDSTDILRFVDRGLAEPARLYPGDDSVARDVAALEDELDLELGTTARRLVYCHLVHEPSLFVEVMSQGLGAPERALLRAAHPVMRRALARAFNVSPRAAARMRERLDAQLATHATRLADGRRYLLGDRFTAADLTLVSLLQPVMLYGRSLDGLPASIVELVSHYRATDVGAWATRVRDEQRALRVV